MSDLDVVIERLDNWINSTKEYRENQLNPMLYEIKEQCKKTNGRVTELESWRDQAKGAAWVIGIIWTILLFVIPILLNAWSK